MNKCLSPSVCKCVGVSSHMWTTWGHFAVVVARERDDGFAAIWNCCCGFCCWFAIAEQQREPFNRRTRDICSSSKIHLRHSNRQFAGSIFDGARYYRIADSADTQIICTIYIFSHICVHLNMCVVIRVISQTRDHSEWVYLWFSHFVSRAVFLYTRILLKLQCAVKGFAARKIITY